MIHVGPSRAIHTEYQVLPDKSGMSPRTLLPLPVIVPGTQVSYQTGTWYQVPVRYLVRYNQLGSKC